MRTSKRVAFAMITLAVTALATACGSDDPAAPPVTVTSTLTESLLPTPTSAAPADAPLQPVTDEPAETTTAEAAPACGPRTLSRATIDAAIATLTRTGATWHVIGSNFSSCNTISYVAVDTVGTATPAPYQLLIFDRSGAFLGTGIKCDVLYQQVVDSGPDFVVVRYNYDGPGQVIGSQTGAAYAMFRWNGTAVVMEGKLPVEVTYGNC